MIEVTSIFSERLKELRGKKTLQEVSDAIGITRVAMGYYEKGDKDVTPASSLNQETVEKLYQELRDGR